MIPNGGRNYTCRRSGRSFALRFSRGFFPQLLSLRRKTVSVPGTAAVVESRSRRRELIEQVLFVAEETTLAHACLLAGQNEDNWIISEELLLPLSVGKRT